MNTGFRAIFFLAIVTIGYVNGYAQKSINLSECLSFTLTNSPKIRAELLQQEHENATLDLEKSRFMPRADAFVNYNNYFNDLPTYLFPAEQGSVLSGQPLTSPYALPLGLPNNLNTGLELSQTVFDMNFFGNKTLLERYGNYSNTKLTIAQEETLHQAAVLFYQTAINLEKLKFLDANLERLSKLQGIVKLQVEQGFARQTDLEKLMVKTSNLQSARNKLSSGIKQQTAYLKLIMGMAQEEEITVNYEEDPGLMFESAPGTALDVQLMQQQRDLHSLNSRRLNAEYYPKLQAYLAFLFQAQRQNVNFFSQGEDWYNIHQWGLKLSIPVIHGFEKKSKKAINEVVDRQLALGIEQKQAQSQLELVSARSDLESARSELAAQEANVALAEKVFGQAELGFTQGTALLMDFLDSESTLREAKMIYATAVLDTRLAELKILKVTGNLKELVNQ
ncbi:MAG: TolC family protein [Cyclobacteriaceae bacterium]|nr:TolC family protein [Cyclobacteriaceae bacterium]